MTFQCGAVVWLYLHVNVSKPLEWMCNFLKELNKVSSCPHLSQRKVLLKPKLFYVKYCCTLSHPWTQGEIIIYYPSPWGIFSASITVSMFIIVNLDNTTGEGKRVGGRANLVWQDKPDNNIVWKNFSQNSTRAFCRLPLLPAVLLRELNIVKMIVLFQ